jgi:hypothetical protein
MTWRGTRTSVVERHGTRWVIPMTWRETAVDVFSGPEGALTLSLHDGDIDPARCRAADEQRQVGWHLASTRNGVAVTARYVERALVSWCGRSARMPTTSPTLPTTSACWRGEPTSS